MPRLVLLLALFTASPALAGTVVIPVDDWLAMQAPWPEEPEQPPAPFVGRRNVEIFPEEDGVRVVATWDLVVPHPGFLYQQLLDDPSIHITRATLDGAPAPIRSNGSVVELAAELKRSGTLRLEGTIPGNPALGTVHIGLMGGSGSRIVVRSPDDLEASITADLPVLRDGGAFYTSAGPFDLALVPPAGPTDHGLLALADVGVGVTIGDAETTVKGRIHWAVRQGELESVSFSAPGAGADVDIIGPDVTSFSRSGDTFFVALSEPQRESVSLDITWTTVTPSGAEATIALPTLIPADAFRVDRSLQLARDSEIEILPQVSGFAPVPSASLPIFGRGLVAGAPTASFRGADAGSGSLELLRFTPVEQPATMVDSATYTIATSDEGRVLMRVYCAVRNERAQNLRILPPDGIKLLGVQVSGTPAIPVDDGRGGWLVPMPRSLETVQGLLSFPVEIIAIGDTPDWDEKREERDLELIRFDAPVALSRVTLYLPPGFGDESETGEGDVVDAFSEGEGLEYGLAVGEGAQADNDLKFQQAVAAWMNNDFDAAQTVLDDLRVSGGDNENVRKLQSNLDLVNMPSEAPLTDFGGASENENTMIVEDAVSRRVKDQARARGNEDNNAQLEEITKAEEAYRAGDYEAASAAYERAIEIGDNLARVEQSESYEVKGRNASASSGYSDAKKKMAEKEVMADKTKQERDRESQVVEERRQSRFGVKGTGAGGGGQGYGAAAPRPARDELEDEYYLDGYESPDGDGRVVISANDIYIVGGTFLPKTPPAEATLPEWEEGERPAWLDDDGTAPSWMYGFTDEEAANYDFGPLNELTGDHWGLDVASGGGYGWAEGVGAYGGVEGGVVGGVLYGEVAEPVSVSQGVVLTSETLQRIPAGRSYQSTVEMAAGSTRGHRGPRIGGMGKKPVEPESPSPMGAFGGETVDDGVPDVYAAALTVVIPALGEPVLYQHLLLPADAGYSVPIRAKAQKSKE